jgi:hypothetical protein
MMFHGSRAQVNRGESLAEADDPRRPFQAEIRWLANKSLLGFL